MIIGSAKRLIKTSLNAMGVNVSRAAHTSTSATLLDQLYEKYRHNTMLGRDEYVANLALTATVRSAGCVIECGVWKGGSSAGMAEILGPDRDYFLFDSYEGHLDPKPIDGPAAFAWQADKGGPWYFDNAVVGTEHADAAMRQSGAKTVSTRQRVFRRHLTQLQASLSNRCIAGRLRLARLDHDLPARPFSLRRPRWNFDRRRLSRLGRLCTRNSRVSRRL